MGEAKLSTIAPLHHSALARYIQSRIAMFHVWRVSGSY